MKEGENDNKQQQTTKSNIIQVVFVFISWPNPPPFFLSVVAKSLLPSVPPATLSLELLAKLIHRSISCAICTPHLTLTHSGVGGWVKQHCGEWVTCSQNGHTHHHPFKCHFTTCMAKGFAHTSCFRFNFLAQPSTLLFVRGCQVVAAICATSNFVS